MKEILLITMIRGKLEPDNVDEPQDLHTNSISRTNSVLAIDCPDATKSMPSRAI